MGMPKQGSDPAQAYRDYYANLATEDARLKFLLMLKERRDFHNDHVAVVLLPELAQAWVSARSVSR
jgi:hypothetical protein